MMDKPELSEVKVVHPEYQPSKVEPEEDLRVDATVSRWWMRSPSPCASATSTGRDPLAECLSALSYIIPIGLGYNQSRLRNSRIGYLTSSLAHPEEICASTATSTITK